MDTITEEDITIQNIDLPKSTYEAIQRGKDIHPENPALIYIPDGNNYTDAKTFSYADFVDEINQAANLFLSLGIDRDDVVSMILPNLPEAHFTLWGAELVGIVSPINPFLEGAVIADILAKTKSKVLVTTFSHGSNTIWGKIEPFIEALTNLEVIVFVNPRFYQSNATLAFPENLSKLAIDWHKSIERQPCNLNFTKRNFTGNEIASIFHTGGTTGTPKLAQHTHYNIVANGWMLGHACGELKGQVFFCGLPLFHANAVIATGITPFSFGATVVLGAPNGYRAEGILDNFWGIVETYGINFFSGVPTIYGKLLEVPIDHHDISSVRFGICGAAPMSVKLFETFEDKTGINILEGYGLTEGTCVSTLNPLNGDRYIGSIGKALPLQEIKIVQLNDEGDFIRICNTNETGTIVIKGPNVFRGYTEEMYNDDIWVQISSDDTMWLNTGDLGRCDENGYFWLTGRQKELIIRGGHNIDPKTIEEALYKNPAVALAAAIGKPDAHLGELPIAYVELKPNIIATSQTLLEFAEQHIGERAAIPKEIHIIDSMPLTSVGKIFKPALVDKEIIKVVKASLQNNDSVDQAEIKVIKHKKYGRIVQIPVKNKVKSENIAEQIDQALTGYAFKYVLV